ncbi:MAG: hypothetical protein E6G54_07985 [Actinobacteria bacterium]|nr:MAG: hypothetical protein E6G54_07985 [Actinomycetota bacterium]
MEADVRTRLAPEVWRTSLDERLTDREIARSGSIEGHIWVGSQELYPGGHLVDASDPARAWSDAIEIDFQEIVLESNVQAITLIFSDLEVAELDTAQ